MTEPAAGVGATTGLPAGTTAGKAGLGALDGEAFLRLMIAQMKYQNPFEPMDTSQMLQQTASLTTVEMLQSLASTQRVLMGLEQATVASSLMGRTVEAITADGARIAGVVTEIGFTADGPMLTIGEHVVPVGNVVTMKQ